MIEPAEAPCLNSPSKKLFLIFRILFGLVGVAFLYVAFFDWLDGEYAYLACATDDCFLGLNWQSEALIGTGMMLVASYWKNFEKT